MDNNIYQKHLVLLVFHHLHLLVVVGGNHVEVDLQRERIPFSQDTPEFAPPLFTFLPSCRMVNGQGTKGQRVNLSSCQGFFFGEHLQDRPDGGIHGHSKFGDRIPVLRSIVSNFFIIDDIFELAPDFVLKLGLPSRQGGVPGIS